MATKGVALGGPYAFLGELAKQVEAKGFDAVWVSETNQDSIVQATHIATVTERVDVGTNITLAFPRSPAITAMEAWDLNELSGERFVIGLGSQVKRIIEERFGADFSQPAKRMAEYVEVMQTAWRQEMGEDVTYEGEIYHLLRPGLNGLGNATDRKMPRVYVAAVGPLMTKAAATHANGILGHPFTSIAYIEDDVIPRVESALDEAGRDRDEFTIAQGVILCISDDRETAVREAKQQIAFYGTTPNYKRVFESYGDGQLTDELRRVWKETDRDLDALVAAVPDDAVDKYAVAGTPDEVKDQLAEYDKLVDHLILGGAWYKVPTQRLGENLWAILETFAS
ncbi:MAG: LLM class flavin-dependent oxidoreductase [Nitriliruptorales bacterium]|nr:LLM class flavin-dependent oxidoreductase [Nitriliruptorales bacterium]